MGEYEVFLGDYFLVLLTSSNLRFLLKKKDQKFKADIMGLPHIAGAPPPCRPSLPALPSLSLASPVEKPCCLGSSRLREACHPNVGLRASLGSMLCGAVINFIYPCPFLLMRKAKESMPTSRACHTRFVYGSTNTGVPFSLSGFIPINFPMRL